MAGTRKKVVVAMSGGVDSSVAAALLKQQGYEVVGCFMRLGSPDGVGAAEEECQIDPAQPQPAKHKQGCCSVLDAGDARRVAQMLDIPFYVLNFQEDFGRVIDYFVSEYNKGRTPNPCVRCNDWLKFGRLAQYAEAVGADYVASGHYARVGLDPLTGQKTLLRGLDHKKDQSYVLFGMPRSHVERLMLPIGEYEKHDVRRMAEEFKLPVFNKPDSQEICFVPDQDYAGLVKRRSPDTFKPGQLVTTTGETVGAHEGHQHFTIGQRKGVGVAFGRPIYVVDIDPNQNRVILGDKEQLLKKSLVANQINVLSDRFNTVTHPSSPLSRVPAGEGRGEGPSTSTGGPHPNPLPAYREREQVPVSLRCQAKIRYNHQPQPATVTLTGDDELTVTFDDPQTAVTPGQAVVCYDGDVVLAGGWIESTSE